MSTYVYIGEPLNWALAQDDLAENGYKLSDGVPLSATGLDPATHRGTSTFVYLDTEHLAQIQAPLLDRYEEPWDEVLKNIGLQVVAPKEVEPA